MISDHQVTGLGQSEQAEWSKRYALSLDRLWVQGPYLGAGLRQTIDRKIVHIVE